MAPERDLDRQKVEEFLDRFVELASGATTIGLLAIADRCGLSRHLAEVGGGTAREVAEGAGLEPRYVEEILAGLAAAGVVSYRDDRFELPDEHALFLADEESPYFMGGWLDMIPAAMSQIDGIAQATVEGGGVGFEEFGSRFAEGIARGNTPSQRVFLASRWLPAVPGLVERLEEGIDVADVGCGSGTAVVEMARAFPASRFFGYDVSEPAIAAARERSSGLANVEFETAPAEEIPLTPGFGLVTTFDTVHDLARPLEGMRRIREALTDEGAYLMMEPNMSSDLADNLSPQGALTYGISVLHCLTQSLARGGVGLGAAWGEGKARELAEEAGFSRFEKLDGITNRFSAFYLLHK